MPRCLKDPKGMSCPKVRGRFVTWGYSDEVTPTLEGGQPFAAKVQSYDDLYVIYI